METPLSNIIKAKTYPAFKSFDFHAIDQDAAKTPGEGTPSAGVPKPWRGLDLSESKHSDPIEELEAAIRNRLLEVERTAQELEREAYEKGYAQGERDGMEYGMKSMAIVKDHLERLLGGLQSVPERVLRDYRDWLISTCLAIARKVVGVELETKPKALVKMIDALVIEAEEHQSLTLYLNPKDLGLLEKTTDFKEWSEKAERSLAIRTDVRLARGGCRIESDIQLLDASIETQFSLIERALRDHASTVETTLPE